MANKAAAAGSGGGAMEDHVEPLCINSSMTTSTMKLPSPGNSTQPYRATLAENLADLSTLLGVSLLSDAAFV